MFLTIHQEEEMLATALFGPPRREQKRSCPVDVYVPTVEDQREFCDWIEAGDSREEMELAFERGELR